MSENFQLREIANDYVDGEIDQDEFIAAVLDELVYQHSTAFWCRVMEARKHNDVNYQR